MTRAIGPFPSAGHNWINHHQFDLEDAEDLGTFKRLLEWADILIDNHTPQTLEDLGLGWDAIHALNPGLVYVSITPYGRTGPRAGAKGDELTIIHAGGLGNLLPARSVDVDRAPVKLGGFQVGYNGGLFAALASMSVLMGRDKTGGGELIDISLQEVVLALVSPGVTGYRYHGTTWSRVPDRPPAMGRMQTSDGYIVINPFDNHHFDAYRKLMGNPDWLEGDDWLSLEYRDPTERTLTRAPR